MLRDGVNLILAKAEMQLSLNKTTTKSQSNNQTNTSPQSNVFQQKMAKDKSMGR